MERSPLSQKRRLDNEKIGQENPRMSLNSMDNILGFGDRAKAKLLPKKNPVDQLKRFQELQAQQAQRLQAQRIQTLDQPAKSRRNSEHRENQERESFQESGKFQKKQNIDQQKAKNLNPFESDSSSSRKSSAHQKKPCRNPFADSEENSRKNSPTSQQDLKLPPKPSYLKNPFLSSSEHSQDSARDGSNNSGKTNEDNQSRGLLQLIEEAVGHSGSRNSPKLTELHWPSSHIDSGSQEMMILHERENPRTNQLSIEQLSSSDMSEPSFIFQRPQNVERINEAIQLRIRMQARQRENEDQDQTHQIETQGENPPQKRCPKCSQHFNQDLFEGHLVDCDYLPCLYCEEHYPSHSITSHLILCEKRRPQPSTLGLLGRPLGLAVENNQPRRDPVCPSNPETHRQQAQARAQIQRDFELALAMQRAERDLALAILLSKKKKLLKREACDHDTENQCAICWENYQLKDKLKVLDCKHDFHSKCINRWLKDKKNCPTCRRKVE